MNVLIARQLAVRVSLLSLVLLVNALSPVIADDTAHLEYSVASDFAVQEGHNDPHQEGVVSLTVEQIATAQIIVEPLQLQLVHSFINAPGEVRFNGYKTAGISPRITV